MGTVSHEEATTESVDMFTTTIRVPNALWRRVKIAAAEHDTSATQICADGLELALKKLAAKKGKAA